MFEVEGMTCAEIAETMGCPAGTVKSRLRLARELVTARLGSREVERKL
jgi:DNA-directed RNA polymerase specialized sigma24 family protein